MKMERNAEILRGWPNEGALETLEVIKSAVTLNNGDIVEKQTDGTVDKVGGTARQYVGLVVVGNGDSSSVIAAGKCLVIWGNMVVKIKAALVNGTPAVGALLWGQSAKLTTQGTEANAATAVVLNVIAASSTDDASYIIAWK